MMQLWPMKMVNIRNQNEVFTFPILRRKSFSFFHFQFHEIREIIVLAGSDEPVTTTAAPKNKPLKLGVRPFRSNDDLLQALKRRQQHMRSAKKVASYKPTIAADEQIEEDLQKPAPSPSTSPVHSQRSTFELVNFFSQ